MKQNYLLKKRIPALLLAVLFIVSLAACGEKGETQASPDDAQTEKYTFTTREIRKSTDGDVILDTPTEYVTEKDGDQERFDSYVWSVEKLKENFDDVIVLDARSEGDYEKEHIVGAVNAKWQNWSNVEVPQDSGEWSLLDSPDVLAEKLAALGIDGSKPVIMPEVEQTPEETVKPAVNAPCAPTEPPPEPTPRKIRKSGTGCLHQINDSLWEGSFYPRLPNGKRKKFNVYAETKEQCEIKLAEMIEQVKAEIAEMKKAANA